MLRVESRVKPSFLDTDVGVSIVGLTFFTTGFLAPAVAGDLTITDGLLTVLVVLWLRRFAQGRLVSGPQVGKLIPPACLIAAGSLIAALWVGLTGWVVTDLAKDVGVFAGFVAALEFLALGGMRGVRFASKALALAVVVVCIHLVFFEPALRAQATFPNPNLAGHFLAVSLIVISVSPLRPVARGALTLVCLAGILATGSFGAALMVSVAIAYWSWQWLRNVTAGRADARMAALAVGALLIAGSGFVAWSTLSRSDAREVSGFSSERLERSAGTRIDLWEEAIGSFTDHPLGIGPGSAGALEVITLEREIHNEYLAYLVERGVLGLAGLLWLGWVLWRTASPGGVARALILAAAAASFVRETTHYRHLWLGLALALTLDRLSRQSSADARDDAADPEVLQWGPGSGVGG